MYDIFIIGGGINGAGIACDAAGRGLKVALVEKHDFASGTSSKSSKLAHGGLRYLEQFKFRLVKEALIEREFILNKAPHITKPLQFIIPLGHEKRPRWVIRFGLFLYDHLARRRAFGISRSINLDNQKQYGLKAKYQKAFSYWDGWVDDARLVIINLQKAKKHGADIFPRTKFVSARQENGYCSIKIKNMTTGKDEQLQAKCLINAGGAWALGLAKQIENSHLPYQDLWVKGSHLLVPKLYVGDQATLMQNDDGRVVFAIPSNHEQTMVGTTDEIFSGDLDDIKISDAERDYLLSMIDQYFAKKITPPNIIHEFAGVRPLFVHKKETAPTPSKASRDYILTLDQMDEGKGALCLTVLGGKLTTYRRLAEKAVDLLKPSFPHMRPCQTKEEILPGGNFEKSKKDFAVQLKSTFHFLPQSLLDHFISTYGSLTSQILGSITKLEELGTHFGGDLYEKEVLYLIKEEWAFTAEDILWRRTKQGLFFSDRQVKNLEHFIKQILVI